MTADIVPAAIALATDVMLELALNGGHMDFVGAGAQGQPYCWLDRGPAEYLRDGIEHQTHGPTHVVPAEHVQQTVH